jgi:hypothetical protein
MVLTASIAVNWYNNTEIISGVKPLLQSFSIRDFFSTDEVAINLAGAVALALSYEETSGNVQNFSRKGSIEWNEAEVRQAKPLLITTH